MLSYFLVENLRQRKRKNHDYQETPLNFNLEMD